MIIKLGSYNVCLSTYIKETVARTEVNEVTTLNYPSK